MEVLGVLRRLSRLPVVIERASRAVRYGFSKVFAFSLNAIAAFVFRFNQVWSSWIGESGRGGRSACLCVWPVSPWWWSSMGKSGCGGVFVTTRFGDSG